MLLYGCFNIDISGPQTQYLKTFPTFSREAELQPQRASRTLSFPQTRCFGVCSFNANEEDRGGFTNLIVFHFIPFKDFKHFIRAQY